jgi:hypothetical protein
MLHSYILKLYPQRDSRGHHHHHHQPINVLTAGAQAFHMDYPQGEPRGPSADWWVLTTANAAGSLTCLPKHGGARDDEV